MKNLKLSLLSGALVSVLCALPAIAQECATKPVVVGMLPKLDTDPYFRVAKGGAEDAAKEIGGSLNVQSDGPGHGATFVLDLPHNPSPPAHENSLR